MKVLFFIVNYKADDYLLKLIKSIYCSKSAFSAVEVSIYVLDNSMKEKAEAEDLRSLLNKQDLTVVLLNNDTNIGYFGGLPIAQGLVDDSFDYVIYCNPDIQIELDFFEKLGKLDKKAGIIAPDIVDEYSGFNENPKYLERLTKRKMQRLKFFYGSLMLYRTYVFSNSIKELMASIRHKYIKPEEEMTQKIYAPHGAMFVFSDIRFFKQLPAYPCFLFGEELFIAEEALKANVEIYYEPELKVKDIRSVSINSLNLRLKRSFHFKSIEFILDKYYSL